MPRLGLTQTTRNLNEEVKKKIVGRRLASLCKQANKLSDICDVRVGIICFGPQGTFAWPSLGEVHDMISDYHTWTPERQRPLKLVTHEDYLQSLVNGRAKHINKIEQMVEEKEMENVFNQLVKARKRFDELSVREINGLSKLFVVKRAKLEERKKMLANETGANDN